MITEGFFLSCDGGDGTCETEAFIEMPPDATVFDRYEVLKRIEFMRVRTKEGASKHFCDLCWDELVMGGGAKEFQVLPPFKDRRVERVVACPGCPAKWEYDSDEGLKMATEALWTHACQ